MAEGAQNGIAHVHESTPHLETSMEEHERPFTSPPPTREAMSILHQRRQKCELKRLLKHTCPELKNVDNLVEEELADFLNIDPVDTKYQSEVQSRCWMFENHETSSVDLIDQKLQVKKNFHEGDFKRTVCMFEQPTSISHNEENNSQLNESEEVTSEQSIRVDVKATRKMFEAQSVDILRDIQSPCPRKNEENSGLAQKIISEIDGKEASDIHHGFDSNEVFVGVSKAKQVFETMSYDKENIPPTNDSFNREEELLKANVRNRAQMFESTPLDKINQQTKEESETILENMQEVLVSLCNFSIMHSGGTILEANESGYVKKARYLFIEEDVRPEVHEEEIVTGSIKSIMLQMLSGINFNLVVTLLKEDSQGNVEIQKVDVPIHQLPFTQDKECRTANVVQIIEDLLGQEKSQKKGVLIQDGTTGTREITVYALFIHSEDNVRVMGFGKIEDGAIPTSLRNEKSEKIDIKTDISSSESYLIVETSETSNVQTFQGCTEKTEADTLEHQQEISGTEESEKTREIIPDNVNNIKALFCTSTDRDEEPKVLPTESLINIDSKLEESNQFESSTNTGDNLKNKGILQDQGTYEDGAVLQAELVDVVEDDELVNLQTAIMNLHQATIEAKALQQSVHAKQAPQTQQICDPGSVAEELTQNGNINENRELSQIAKTEQEEENKEEVMRGSLQAALDSLGKSNFNVTKGDFKAAMIYRNSGKGCAGCKKTDGKQPIDQTKENKSSSAHSTEKETLLSPGKGTGKTPCENKLLESKPVTLQVSLDPAPKTHKTPLGPKPALPPKPDHLKIKPNPVGAQTDPDSLKRKVPAKSSKPPIELIKEPSTPKPNPDPNYDVQKADHNNQNPNNTSMSNTESHEDKKCKVHVHPSKPPTEQIKETSTPKSNSDLKQGVQKADHNNHNHNDTSMGNTESPEDKKCEVSANSSNPPTEQIKESSTSKSNPDPNHDVQNADHNNHNPSDTSMGNNESPENKKCEVSANSSKPPTEQVKEPSSPKSNPDPNHDVQNADHNNHSPSDTSMSNTESPEYKSIEDTPKCSPESIVSETSTGPHATLQNFGVKPSGSVPPAKPKRIKMAKENSRNVAVNSSLLEIDRAQGIPTSTQDNDDTCKVDSNKHEVRSNDQQVSQVVRRKKKVRGETEDERRQRLSVHMDEIMKVNVPAVMEIFDKLKQQEELKNILSKVEEIEEDTNKVDVSSLKNIFESVPDWVVPQEQPKFATLEDLEEPSEPEIKSSMEVAFGDLEKAGAEIIRLKDQTLARLMDIEEAIKKALYSVSTLKSDSDIVGLSGLFRESMVAVQGSPPSGNIRKISIGSSKSPKALNQIGRSQQSMAQKKPELFIPKAKPRSTSPGSPSFISIQSAARKPSELPSPLKEEPNEEPKPQCCCSVPSDRRQCSVTKSLSSSPTNPQRQVSVLEVKTMPEAERVIGTKTIKENYERTDSFGNKFYSTKTSTVVTTQPETRTTSRKLIMSNPAMSEIVTYPRINTPFIREDHSPV